MPRVDVKVAILDSAEALFAELGYHGVSLRQVAEGAGISLSLVQYHFKTKEELYSTVMGRRILAINHERLARLDHIELEAAKSGGKIEVEAVLRAFLEPTVLFCRDPKIGGGHFAKLIAQVANDPQPHARNVSQKYYDPISRQTMRVLKRALPGLDDDTLAWCYVLAVGAMIAAVSPIRRAHHLTGGRIDDDDVGNTLGLLVPFLAGAFERVAQLAGTDQLKEVRALSLLMPLPSAQMPPARRRAKAANT